MEKNAFVYLDVCAEVDSNTMDTICSLNVSTNISPGGSSFCVYTLL
jgi:hypothetical protein